MKLKACVKYRYKKLIIPLSILYVLVILLYIVGYISLKESNYPIDYHGLYPLSMIFLFVVGLTSFKPEFKLFCQNGVSRQTQFKSFLALLPIVIPMAIVDVLFYISFTKLEIPYTFRTLFIYDKIYSTKLWFFMFSFVIVVFLYLFILSFGYFLSLLYYKMDRVLRIIVSTAVPGGIILFCTYYSLINQNQELYQTGKISKAIMYIAGSFCCLFFGDGWGYPIDNHVFAYTVLSVIILSFSCLLIRKANIKGGKNL